MTNFFDQFDKVTPEKDQNFFDQFDEEIVATEQNFFDQFDEAVNEENTLADNVQAANQKVLDGLFLGFGDEFVAAAQATSDEFLEGFRS